MSPKTDTVATLEAALAAAQEAAALAEAKAVAARQASEERRAKAHRAYDERVIEQYDEAPLDAEVTAAEETLRQAVLADPVHAAAVALTAARLRRHQA